MHKEPHEKYEKKKRNHTMSGRKHEGNAIGIRTIKIDFSNIWNKHQQGIAKPIN